MLPYDSVRPLCAAASFSILAHLSFAMGWASSSPELSVGEVSTGQPATRVVHQVMLASGPQFQQDQPATEVIPEIDISPAPDPTTQPHEKKKLEVEPKADVSFKQDVPSSEIATKESVQQALPKPKPKPKPKPIKSLKPVEKVVSEQGAASRHTVDPIEASPVSASRSIVAEHSVGEPDAEPVRVVKAKYREVPRPPKYPRKAKRKKQQGEVLLHALVDPRGVTLEIKVVHGSGFELLDKAALKAAKRWLFEPAKEGGVAIESWVSIPVTFKLN